MHTDWQPEASLASLRQTASTLADIRAHFNDTAALEVITPALSRFATTDPNIHSLTTECEGADPSTRYLHTSPEFPMKRLLSAGSGDIYQICKVFRAGERGGRHNPEFTLLEWYRTGIDHIQLMQEVDALVRRLWPSSRDPLPKTDVVTYSMAIESAAGVSLDDLDTTRIRELLRDNGTPVPDSMSDNLDDWLDLLMSEVIFPTFKPDRFTFLHDYPVSQAALSKIGTNAHGKNVAERFELFFGALELANGFHELCDSVEQRDRFEQDIQQRRVAGLPLVPKDECLLGALADGFPPSAGVAMGIERLMMVLQNKPRITDVLSFGFDRA